MTHLSVRLDGALAEALDRLQDAHGLHDRSEATRVAIVHAVADLDADTGSREHGDGLPTRTELLRALSRRALAGHVPAVRLLLDELRRDADAETPADPDWDAIYGGQRSSFDAPDGEQESVIAQLAAR